MPIATTTPKDIREGLIPLIEAISPSLTQGSEYGWRHVDDVEIAGLEPRTFVVLHGPAQEDPGGIHGAGGVGYVYECRLQTAYGGLSRELAEDMVDHDAADLWRLLHPLPNGTAGALDGLLPFTTPIEVDYVQSEPGEVVVDYVLEVRFKRADA